MIGVLSAALVRAGWLTYVAVSGVLIFGLFFLTFAGAWLKLAALASGADLTAERSLVSLAGGVVAWHFEDLQYHGEDRQFRVQRLEMFLDTWELVSGGRYLSVYAANVQVSARAGLITPSLDHVEIVVDLIEDGIGQQIDNVDQVIATNISLDALLSGDRRLRILDDANVIVRGEETGTRVSMGSGREGLARIELQARFDALGRIVDLVTDNGVNIARLTDIGVPVSGTASTAVRLRAQGTRAVGGALVLHVVLGVADIVIGNEIPNLVSLDAAAIASYDATTQILKFDTTPIEVGVNDVRIPVMAVSFQGHRSRLLPIEGIATDVDVAALGRLLAALELSEGRVAEVFEGLYPKGRASEIEWGWDRPGIAGFHLAGDVSELSIDDVWHVPKVTGAAGRVHMRGLAGTAYIDVQDSTLFVSRVFNDTWMFDAGQVRLDWVVDLSTLGFQVQIRDVALEAYGGTASLDMRIRQPTSDVTNLTISVRLALQGLTGIDVSPFLPRVSSLVPVSEWIDGAIDTTNIETFEMLFEGNPRSTDPWNNHIQLAIEVKDTDLLYAEGYAPITGANASVRVDNALTTIIPACHAPGDFCGAIHDVPVHEGIVTVQSDLDGGAGLLWVKGVARGSAKEMYAFVVDSPFSDDTRETLTRFQFDGDAVAHVNLTMELPPLQSGLLPSDPDVDIVLDIENGRFDFPDQDLTWLRAHGRAFFSTGEGLWTEQSLVGEAFGYPTTVDIAPGAGADGPDATTLIAIDGRVNARALEPWMRTIATRRLEGHTDYRVNLQTARIGSTESTVLTAITLRSDLTDLLIDFPDPYHKEIGEPRPIEVRLYPEYSERATKMWVDYADVQANLIVGPTVPITGVIAVGSPVPDSVPRFPERLELSAHMERGEIMAWVSFVDDLRAGVDPNAPESGHTSVHEAHVSFGNATLLGSTIGAGEMRLWRPADEPTSYGRVSTANSQMVFEIPDSNLEPTEIFMTTLPLQRGGFSLSGLKEGRARVANSSGLSAPFQLFADEVSLDNYPIGALSVDLRPNEDHWTLDIRAGEATRAATTESHLPSFWTNGTLMVGGESDQTAFDGRVEISGLTDYLKAQRVDVVTLREVIAEGAVSWDGGLTDVSLDTLVGELSLVGQCIGLRSQDLNFSSSLIGLLNVTGFLGAPIQIIDSVRKGLNVGCARLPEYDVRIESGSAPISINRGHFRVGNDTSPARLTRSDWWFDIDGTVHVTSPLAFDFAINVLPRLTSAPVWVALLSGVGAGAAALVLQQLLQPEIVVRRFCVTGTSEDFVTGGGRRVEGEGPCVVAEPTLLETDALEEQAPEPQ